MKIIKKYSSNSEISIKAYIGGFCRRFHFETLSGGRSFYITDKEEEQTALEEHPWFRHAYRLEATYVEEEPKEQKKKQKEEDSIQTLEFSTFDEAKEYLATTFEISRLKMKNMDDLEREAASVQIAVVIKHPAVPQAAPTQEKPKEPETKQIPEAGKPKEEDEQSGNSEQLQHIKVADLAEAKEYICSHSDTPRSSLRSKASIVKAGEAIHVEFEGI